MVRRKELGKQQEWTLKVINREKAIDIVSSSMSDTGQKSPAAQKAPPRRRCKESQPHAAISGGVKSPNDKRSHPDHRNTRNNKRQRVRAKQEQQAAAAPPQVCSVCEVANDDGAPPKYKCPKCRASYCSVACCRQHKTICPGKEDDSSSKAIATTGDAATTAVEKTKPGANQATSTTNIPTVLDSAAVNDSASSDDEDDDSSLEDGWEITESMKVALRNSMWLRHELRDGGLRDMIASVVKSRKTLKRYETEQRSQSYRPRHRYASAPTKPHHPHEVLAAQKSENRHFRVFTDKLLVLADVLERQEGPTLETEGLTSNQHHPRNEEELEEWLRRPWDPTVPPPVLALKPRMRKVIPKFEPIDISSSEDEDENDDAVVT